MDNIKKSFISCLVILTLVMLSLNISFAKPVKILKKPKMVKVKKLNYAPGQLLVKFKSKTSKATKRILYKKSGILRKLSELGRGGQSKIELVQLRKISVRAAKKFLNKQKAVEYAEPNYILEEDLLPDDTFFDNQWAFLNTGQIVEGVAGVNDADIDMINAWDKINTSERPIVAVIDSGVDINHPDMDSNIWRNSDEVADNNADDDRNGYVDDVNGFNFAGIAQYANNSAIAVGYGKDQARGLGQQIKGRGEKLSHIGLSVSKSNNPVFGLTVSVKQSLNGAALAKFVVKPDEESLAENYIYKGLNKTITLTSGQTYFIVIQPNKLMKVIKKKNTSYLIGANVDDPASLNDNYVTNTYYDGNEHVLMSGQPWVSNISDDLYFYTNSNNNVLDDRGHGTHVAGIIAAETDNGGGVAGVARSAQIMPVKSNASSGGFLTSDVVDAINYAADNGAKVINMSFGSYSFIESIRDAVKDAYENEDVILFGSAGNDNIERLRYPASYGWVVAVSATDSDDTLASYSNYGNHVDLSAPGTSIISTTPTYDVASTLTGLTKDYDYLSGTSMATPMAAGLAAAFLTKYPSFKPNDIKAAMQGFSQDLGKKGRDKFFGYGRINAELVMNGDTIAPSKPAITSTSHPLSDKYYPNKEVRFSWASSDNLKVKNYSYVLNTIANSDVDNNPETFFTGKNFSNMPNGTYYLHVKALDYFGNASEIGHFAVNIDGTRPQIYAYTAVRVRRFANATIRYRVTDTYSGGKAHVFLKFIHSNGLTSQTKYVGLVNANQTLEYTYNATLPVGTHQYEVYATDRAGNTQQNIASNTLTITQ